MQPITETLSHPATSEIELGAVLHALSDEVRLSIVLAVADNAECAMGGIDVPVSKSTCTHHFKVLRDAGVLRQRQVGTARLNTLRAEELNQRFPGLLDSVLSAARARRGAPSPTTAR
jgi:DNA-binding transcriptional ArsR family regulator